MYLLKIKTLSLLFILILFNSTLSAESIVEIYNTALKEDPVSKSAQLAVQVSQYQQEQAEGRFYPTATISGSISRNELSEPGASSISYEGKTLALGVSQKILDMYSYEENERKKLLLNAKQLDYKQAINDLIIKVIERYLTVLSSEDELNFLEQREKAVIANLQQINALYRKQLVSIVGVYEAQAQLDLLKSEKITADANLASAYERLYEITRKRITSIKHLNHNQVFSFPEQTIDSWVSRALEQSPTLAAAKEQYQASGKELKSVEAQYYPVISLNLGHNYQDIATDNTPRPETNISSISLQFSQPFYNVGINAQKREYLHQLDIVEQKVIEIERQLEQQVREIYLKLSSDVLAIKAYKKQIETEQKRREAMQSSFKFGTVSVKDVFDADISYYKSLKEYRLAQYSYIKNEFLLKSMAGELSEQDLIKLDKKLN
ncbi:MAG: TolC family protein [Gammaproteobacteria bacterium]|nr:TolC family protein [Gammaproteobacteria bacterium]